MCSAPPLGSKGLQVRRGRAGFRWARLSSLRLAFCITVNLLVADQTFGEQFELGADTFDDFMDQLSDGKLKKKEGLAKLLIEAFAIGINLK